LSIEDDSSNVFMMAMKERQEEVGEDFFSL